MVEEKEVRMSNDLLFKEMLCHKDNRDILIHFIKLMTGIEEEKIKRNLNIQYESVLTKTKLSDKAYRADVLVKFDGYIINLESYSYFSIDSFRKSTNYIMRIYSTLSRQGKKEKGLESVIQVNLIDNVKMEFDKNIMSDYYIINGKILEDKKLGNEFKMIYYRIDKAKEIPYNELTEEERWVRFIGAQSSEERKLLAKGDGLLMKLNDWVEKFINNEEIKEYYGKWAEELAKEQGEYEKTEEIARKMKEKGYSISEIVEITNISEEEIEKL